MKGKLVPIDFSKIPVVNLCPKCGSEMTDDNPPLCPKCWTKGYDNVSRAIFKVFTGHEEKLKDGEG